MSDDCRNPLQCAVIHELKTEMFNVNTKLDKIWEVIQSLVQVSVMQLYRIVCSLFTRPLRATIFFHEVYVHSLFMRRPTRSVMVGMDEPE